MKDNFMKDIAKLSKIETKKIKLRQKIAKKTKKLQAELQDEKNKETYIQKNFESYWKDENNHPLKRIYLWLKFREDNDDIDTLPEELEMTVFNVNELSRGGVYDIREAIRDYVVFNKQGGYRLNNFKAEQELTKETIKEYDALDEETKAEMAKSITAIIYWDLTEFRNDW